MAAKFDGRTREYSDFDLHVGRRLIDRKDPHMEAYCNMKAGQLGRVLEQLGSMEGNEVLKSHYNGLRDEYLALAERLRNK